MHDEFHRFVAYPHVVVHGWWPHGPLGPMPALNPEDLSRADQACAVPWFWALPGCPALEGSSSAVPCAKPDDSSAAEKPSRRRGGRNRNRKASVTAVEDSAEREEPSCLLKAARSAGARSHSALDLESEDGCAGVIQQLEALQGKDKLELLTQLAPSVRQLSTTRSGCRVVQKAIEVAGNDGSQPILKELKGHTMELLNCPHGNHVLQKMVEAMPPSSIDFVVAELTGRAKDVAKHKFGCRVLERVMEHFPEEVSFALVEEVIKIADVLVRHQYGNFVMSHILEHGIPAHRASIIQALIPGLPGLATHKAASHVVQRALEVGDLAAQRALVASLVRDDAELLRMACSRCGSYVTEQLLALPAPAGDGVRSRLLASSAELRESQFGCRVVARLQRAEAEPPAPEPPAPGGCEAPGGPRLQQAGA